MAVNRLQYKVACGCGASLMLDARSFGRPTPCRTCKSILTVAWGRDPGTRKTVPVIVNQKRPPGPAPSRSTAPSAPGKEPQARFKPSAPLLPLHLRPPVRVGVKPGARFFVCPCGERILLTSQSVGRSLQCPNCDRFHHVELEAPEVPAAVKAGPAAAAGVPAPGPPKRTLRLGEFLCKCGEIQPPRTSRTGKEFECKACGRKGRVEPGREGLQTVFTHEPPAGFRSPAAAAPPAAAKPSWTCPCGHAIESLTALGGKDSACPACGRAIRIEKRRDPQTLAVTLRPVFSEEAAAAPAGDAAVFEVVAGDASAGDAVPAAPSDAQTAPCPCGADLLVTREYLGQTIQCPACGTASVIEESRGTLKLRALEILNDDAEGAIFS